MKTLKMNLESIQGTLSRVEMKNIMAGSGLEGCGKPCVNNLDCKSYPCTYCVNNKCGMNY